MFKNRPLYFVLFGLILCTGSLAQARGFAGKGTSEDLKNCQNKRVIGGRVVCVDEGKSPQSVTRLPVRPGSAEALKHCKNKRVVGKRVKCMDGYKEEQAAKNATIEKVKTLKMLSECRKKKVVGRSVKCVDDMETTQQHKKSDADKS